MRIRPSLSAAGAGAAAMGLLALLLLGPASSASVSVSAHRPFVGVARRHSTALGVPRGGGGRGGKKAPAAAPASNGKKDAKGTVATASPLVTVGDGTASITNLVLNLVKAVVGVGVLSLPRGITSFGDAPSAVVPAVILVGVMGTASAYGFGLIGRCCAYTGAKSYREAWDRTVGEGTGWVVAGACAAKGFFAVLAYSMGLADTFRGIFQSLGYDVSRSHSLLIVTTLCLLPLCLLKNLAALAPFSLAGIVAMLFAGSVMALRYFGGEYALGGGAAAEGAASGSGGKYLADLAEEFVPKFGTEGIASVFKPGTFVFVCMLSTAFMAHFNAPKFYLELKDNTLPRFNTVVSASFLFSVLIQASIMAVGYLTFGSASSGLVLNNYSPGDALVSVARIAVAFAVVFTYPMPFVGCRDGVLDLMNVPREKRTDAYVNFVTVSLLGLVTAAALKLTDISFVLSFGGATLGNALIYVFPGLMFRGAVEAMGDKATDGLRRETTMATVHAAAGVVLGTLGAIYAVKGTGGGH